MAGTIGIKVANGDFYPIVDENSPVKKRLVLTTVHDSQDSVQIDLFRSISKSMLDAQYIGSLVVEDIRPCKKGEASIEMIIFAADDGNITAEAYDMEADPESDHHILNVSLKTMDTFTRPEDFPDFDVDEEPQEVNHQYEKARHTEKTERKFPWAIMAVAALLVIAAIAVLWFFLLRDNGGFAVTGNGSNNTEQAPAHAGPPPAEPAPPAPPPPAPPPPPPPQPVQQVQPPAAPETVAMPATPEPPPVVISPPVIQAPAVPPAAPVQTIRRERPPAPVLSHRVPAVIPPNGVVYQIRWGDTLWDIAAAFYRDPLQYPRIARHNNIRDPNLILAGFNVRIPPIN